MLAEAQSARQSATSDGVTAMTSASAPVLTDQELLTFAGLARLLIEADGEFTAEEQFIVEKVHAELLGPRELPGSPYRSDRGEAVLPDPEATWMLVQRAGRELGDRQAVVDAAERIAKPEVREAIYGALREIAEADVIDKAEWPLLEWLERVWELQSSPST
jgi:hypothetical protein